MTAASDFAAHLPHRPPMLMLTELVQQQAQSIHCRSVITADNPMLEHGLLPTNAGIELLAQAAGLLLGALHPGDADDHPDQPLGRPPAQPGAIVQIKTFHSEPATIPVGTELHIHARYQAGNADAALFDGEVKLGAQTVFSATLMIALLPQHPATGKPA